MILLARTGLGSTQRQKSKANAEEPSLATSAALVNTKGESQEVNDNTKDSVPAIREKQLKGQLRDDRGLTLKRLKRTCKKMGEKNSLKEYTGIFDEWEALKIIEKVTETEIETDAYYLQHRSVLKISETTKIRPVFDATAREGNNPSLNDRLLKDTQEIGSFVNKVRKIMSNGCFNLRGWESNVKKESVSKCEGDAKVLGLIWNLERDTLRCTVNNAILEIQSAEIGKSNDVPLDAEALEILSAGVDVSESAIPVNAPPNMPKVSRYGRTIQRPRRLNVFNVVLFLSLSRPKRSKDVVFQNRGSSNMSNYSTLNGGFTVTFDLYIRSVLNKKILITWRFASL
ncbi:uncharacterized protein TNCV_3471451 [Trichonephila clavipes]|nr:uncharacterized protein TNCV_3471451 [Trichonephila clavipes]